MSGTTEYIEAYFKQTLNTEERKTFEAKCETDEAFAKQVAIYLTARQALREELLQQKIQQWKGGVSQQEEPVPVIPMQRRTTFVKWVMYAAAACLLLVASVYLFEANSSPKRLAVNYIQTNYASLSHTMDASHDSLQSGIEAYNNKNYDKALQLFLGVQKNDPANSDAKKYAGVVYLQQQDYDKAVQQFDELANMKGLYSNPGDFLKAVSLLERNRTTDKEEAKILLQKVVNEKEEGYQEAEKLMKKF
jgi:tetratricopeptide (TPR) repeat protein